MLKQKIDQITNLCFMVTETKHNNHIISDCSKLAQKKVQN